MNLECLFREGAVGARGAYDDGSSSSIGFAVDGASDSDFSGHGVDGEASTVVIDERIGNRVGGGIGIGGQGGDSDARSNSCILVDRVNGRRRVYNLCCVKLIDVSDMNVLVLVIVLESLLVARIVIV